MDAGRSIVTLLRRGRNLRQRTLCMSHRYTSNCSLLVVTRQPFSVPVRTQCGLRLSLCGHWVTVIIIARTLNYDKLLSLALAGGLSHKDPVRSRLYNT